MASASHGAFFVHFVEAATKTTSYGTYVWSTLPGTIAKGLDGNPSGPTTTRIPAEPGNGVPNTPKVGYAAPDTTETASASIGQDSGSLWMDEDTDEGASRSTCTMIVTFNDPGDAGTTITYDANTGTNETSILSGLISLGNQATTTLTSLNFTVATGSVTCVALVSAQTGSDNNHATNPTAGHTGTQAYNYNCVDNTTGLCTLNTGIARENEASIGEPQAKAQPKALKGKVAKVTQSAFRRMADHVARNY